jgi:heme/copper-type cytochrome/quinol oxidase subunit 2
LVIGSARLRRWRKRGLIQCFPLPEEEREASTYPDSEGLVLVVVMVVVVGIVSVMIIAMVVGHRVANGRAANTAYHRADWTAHNRPADRASDASGYGST